VSESWHDGAAERRSGKAQPDRRSGKAQVMRDRFGPPDRLTEAVTDAREKFRLVCFAGEDVHLPFTIGLAPPPEARRRSRDAFNCCK
jgi:hypothetical protein